MSVATVQSLSALGAVNSSVVSIHHGFPDLPEKIKGQIVVVNKLVIKAFQTWEQHAKDKDRVLDILAKWEKALNDTGKGDNPSLTVLAIMGQTALQHLLDVVTNKSKVNILEQLLDAMEDIVGYLLAGTKDKYVAESVDKAEGLLSELFLLNGFEVA